MNILANMQYKNGWKRSFLCISCYNSEKWFNFAFIICNELFFYVIFMEQNLFIYNTLSRRKEVFEPLHAPNVGMYVCGPTVYGDPLCKEPVSSKERLK